MQPDLDPQQGSLAHLLRELPRQAVPPYGFHEFERRAEVRARDVRGRLGGQRLAAAAVIGVGVLAILVRLSAPAIPVGHVSVPGAVPLARVAPGPEDDSLAPGAGATQRWLERLPSEPAVVHVGTRAAVMGLEDRIAQVDDLLSTARGAPDPRRLATLQQERARLVDTLLQVRYAETLANATP